MPPHMMNHSTMHLWALHPASRRDEHIHNGNHAYNTSLIDHTGVHQFAVNFVSTKRGPAAKCGGEYCGIQFTWYRPLVYVSRKA